MPAGSGSASGLRRWGAIAGALVAVFILGVLSSHYHLRSPFGTGDAGSVLRPRPAEFLYLDNERVGAYLAQLTGGIAKSERLSETLRNEDSAKVSGGDLFEVGASSQRENFVERQVTPTAAANFFRLLADLIDQERLEDVEVDDLEDFKELDEGSFVRFTSHDLRAPVYVNSYLVVRQAGTLKALFPTAGADEYEREQILARRENAKSYAHQVGPNPRIVFALTPGKEEEASGGAPAIQFLLPVRYRQLTDERSLIKDGGGGFKVVGKVARMFRTPAANGNSSYIDSPTRETWKHPLQQVPGQLLERSSALCGTPVGGRRPEGYVPPAKLRACVLKRLLNQTTIPRTGAVILPVAIYK